MSAVSISPATVDFLRELDAHNAKDWFLAHKTEYQKAHDNMAAFAGELLKAMQDHDSIVSERPGNALYRIYNDVRFHKNKPPYNPRFAGGFNRVKPLLRGGYYFQVKPGNSYCSCGFFGPNADDLKRIRQDIAENYEDWWALMEIPSLKDTFGMMQGDQLKTAPSGYAKDHPAVVLLRYKQFIFRHHFTDAEVVAPDFVQQVDWCYRNIRPFFDYMSELLTTDGNGVSLYKGTSKSL
jgi:uncharacterized protein (TIGR02453 family)